jgi:putative ABC transport system permease protein
MLLTAFSAMAMLLAMVGVYGLFSFSVRQRTGEIGIRMALGWTQAGAVALILREGLALVGIGVGVGLAWAVGFTRLLSKFLCDVPFIDPATYIVVPLVLVTGTLIACLVPSLRVAAIDPMERVCHE